MLKTTLLAGCALACVALSGCASPGMAELQAASGSGASTQNIDTLKEVNRHLELCDRTYTLSWPPSGIIHCTPQAPAAAKALTAADVAALFDSALAKLADVLKAPPAK